MASCAAAPGARALRGCLRAAQIKDLGVKAGVVLNPGTSLTTIEEVLGIVDLVLLMSVNPGFGGQKFIESQVAKTRRLKQMCNDLGVNPWIEIDGGVTPANAYKLIDAGANALVAGSAVFGAKSYKDGADPVCLPVRQTADCWHRLSHTDAGCDIHSVAWCVHALHEL